MLLIAPWMRAFYLATKPVVDLFNAMGNLLLKPFGIPPASEAGHAPHSEHELRALLRQSQQAGLIGRDDLELTESSFAFGDRRAGEIMTPRAEIDFVTTRAKLGEVARLALTRAHTRLPVCEPNGGLDAPAGVIHVKDLLEAILEKSEVAPALLARPLARVAESTLLSELLRDLRHQRQHIALVADEHGTTTGLLTLEDILEALVGEIEDEFDIEVSTEIARDGTVAVVRGGAPIQLLAEELRIAVSEPHEATIGHRRHADRTSADPATTAMSGEPLRDPPADHLADPPTCDFTVGPERTVSRRQGAESPGRLGDAGEDHVTDLLARAGH